VLAFDWIGTLGIVTLVGIFLALATAAGSLAQLVQEVRRVAREFERRGWH
jgi:hypothetical protein